MEKHTIQGVSGVDATSFLKMANNSDVRKLQQKDYIKFCIVLVCLMEKPIPSGKKPEVKGAHFSDKMTTKLCDDDVDKMNDDVSEKNTGEYDKISERREWWS